jgi:hypothetical protein|tara:strand:- start:19605 stop:19997 length:393 start_codon:yes stop_codon:yes gene_type:complete
MPLAVGSRLGPYEVVAPIGAGGMGEVYRARDTKLERDIALKILPEAFVNDPERLARFEREAKVLASLNQAVLLTRRPVGRILLSPGTTGGGSDGDGYTTMGVEEGLRLRRSTHDAQRQRRSVRRELGRQR